MVLVNKTIEDMLEEIEFEEWIKYDVLSPKETPEHFFELRNLKRRQISLSYIASIAELINIDDDMIIRDILTNAIARGNKYEKYLPFSVKVFKGKNGYVVRVRDSGPGFDFKEVLAKKRRGEVYFQEPMGGSGFRYFDSENFCVSYEGAGNILNLQVLHKSK